MQLKHLVTVICKLHVNDAIQTDDYLSNIVSSNHKWTKSINKQQCRRQADSSPARVLKIFNAVNK